MPLQNTSHEAEWGLVKINPNFEFVPLQWEQILSSQLSLLYFPKCNSVQNRFQNEKSLINGTNSGWLSILFRRPKTNWKGFCPIGNHMNRFPLAGWFFKCLLLFFPWGKLFKALHIVDNYLPFTCRGFAPELHTHQRPTVDSIKFGERVK